MRAIRGDGKLTRKQESVQEYEFWFNLDGEDYLFARYFLCEMCADMMQPTRLAPFQRPARACAICGFTPQPK